jgi:hypothetical protein
MIVVPIEKDLIKTTDGLEYKVISYTNFKELGPALYCHEHGNKTQTLVYFSDITEINGTKVEYTKGAKMFNALGKLVRKQNLPHPDDKIVMMIDGKKRTVEVDSLKLKSKLLGVNKGIFIKDKEGGAHRLKNVLDIDPAIGGSNFSHKAFHSYYSEYM